MALYLDRYIWKGSSDEHWSCCTVHECDLVSSRAW